MITVNPALLAQLAQQSPEASASGAVVNPSATIAALPSGATLQGVVDTRDAAAGVVTVKTALGPVTVTTTLPLQPDTPVSVQLQNNAAGQQTATLQAEGPPPQTPTYQPSAPAVTVTAPPPPGPTIVAGAVLQATVVRAAPQAVIAAPVNPAVQPVSAADGVPAVPGVTISALLEAGTDANLAGHSPDFGNGQAGAGAPQGQITNPNAALTPPATGTTVRPAVPGLIATDALATGLPETTPMAAGVAHYPASPGTAAAQPGQPIATASASPATASPAPTVALPANAGGPTPPALATATVGERIPLRVVSIAAPEAGAVPTPIAQASPSAPGTSLGAPATLPSPSLATGTPVSVLPGLTNGAAPVPVVANFTAQVVGTNAAGHPIVSAGAALATLDAAPLPVGTVLTLAPDLAAIASSSSSSPALKVSSGLATFDSLPDIVAAAPAAGPAATAALTAALPKIGPRLAAEMMVFISAARQGNAGAWIGESARAALDRAGRGKLSQRLVDDFTDAAKSAGSEDDGGWLSLTVPVVDGRAIQPIRLYVRGVQDEEEGKDKASGGKGGSRFLIDMTLSQFGTVQLDGLVRGDDKMDLVIRTSKPLGPEVASEVSRLYSDQISARGIAGQVMFQVAPPIVPDTKGTQTARRPGVYA